LNWFEKLFHVSDVTHISENDTSEERTRRLTTLSDEEQRVHKWLFEGYSEAWTTETLGIEKRDAKTLFAGIYRKLGVVNSREIIHYYAPREVRFESPPDMGKKDEEK